MMGGGRTVLGGVGVGGGVQTMFLRALFHRGV